MTIVLGLDLGSNSVGSAWIDTESREITAGVSVFPAGVDETGLGRGAPKNQDRREKRSLRRTLARRSTRKRELRRILTDFGLLPTDAKELKRLLALNPWSLRRRGLGESLMPIEFGRVLVHLNQRRGAFGLKPQERDDDPKESDSSSDEDAKVKSAVEKTKQDMSERKARTFGELMAILLEERSSQHKPVRNRGQDNFEFHADRALIRDEFLKLWERQNQADGALASLSEERKASLRKVLDNPQRDKTWRHKGIIFGQRNTYWDTGTLGRCDLEPTDRCVPIADRHASYYRVVETVNNIRIQGPDDRELRPLTVEERRKIIDRLRSQKTGTVAAVRSALGIDKRSLRKNDIPENAWSLNIEKDDNREINTDWFYRKIVLSAIGSEPWARWTERTKEGLNRAILKCDPAVEEDGDRLFRIGRQLGLDDRLCKKLLSGWKTRPKLERRLNLSRQAVQNLLPYMEQPWPDGRWPTQIEARRMFAEDGENHATAEQRKRYHIGAHMLTKADRVFLKKHPNELPPAPMLSNPVVRKAIHEVRRHVIAHIRAHGGRKPDRIAIEFARETNKSKKLSDEILFRNRRRERIRKQIVGDILKPAFGARYGSLSANQEKRAIERVLLARQQRNVCAYSGTKYGAISDFAAARGDGLEIDHIIPYSRCGNNSWTNRVLCWQKSNRDKGNQTPREWWGEQFEERSRPMEKILNEEGPQKEDYFTMRDYAFKWKNFSATEVPSEWRGSQLTDTAYAARQVQTYLQSTLWPDEPSHLESGQRRIFVTKGAYTHLLRKDWRLFQRLVNPKEDSQKDLQDAAVKNRGDHREHALDAVAIALACTPGSVARGPNDRPSTRIDDLAHSFKVKERDPEGKKRQTLPPPWGTLSEFRNQVISLIYGGADGRNTTQRISGNLNGKGLVVSHRPIGRKITGPFHRDMLFGTVPDMENTYTGRKSVLDITPNHLREPAPESRKASIERLMEHYLQSGVESTESRARARALAEVESPDFTPPLVDPPPGKSGLVRDLDLRKRIRECIASYEYRERDRDGNVKTRYHLDPDDFKAKEIKQAFEAGAIRHESGVAIKRVKLLRTMTDPVIIHRKKWSHKHRRWVRDTGKDGNLDPDQRSRADRAYESRNNHHMESREHDRGRWSGTIVSMFEAARRTRIQSQDAVDRSNDSAKGGRFIMSLSEGETVFMKGKDTDEADFYVVFKLDKPSTVQLKHHWDARRSVGEKDDDNRVIDGTKRKEIGVSAAQLRDLAPPGYDYPFKVRVSPIGEITELHGD